MSRLLWSCAVALLWLCGYAQKGSPANADSEALGRAIAYYQGGKYHEALLIFERLNGQYQLNPRFKAYLAVCHYYAEAYRKTADVLDTLMPRLAVFAPRECAVYAFVAAESHFQLQEYTAALRHYESAVELSAEHEKGYLYYRAGCCCLFTGQWSRACQAFEQSLSAYEASGIANPHKAQTLKMLQGCRNRLLETSEKMSGDSQKDPKP